MTHKPSSLVNLGRINSGCSSAPVNTIIEDFTYQGEGDGSESDDGDGEDKREYLGGMAKSLVCPSPPISPLPLPSPFPLYCILSHCQGHSTLSSQCVLRVPG